MKYLVLLVVSAVAVLGDKPHHRTGIPPFLNKDLTDADYDSCMSSSNVKISELESFHPGGSVDPSANTLCFWKCIAEKVKFINSEGIINSNVFMNNDSPIPQEMRGQIQKCMDEVAKIETCEDMNKIHMCMKH